MNLITAFLVVHQWKWNGAWNWSSRLSSTAYSPQASRHADSYRRNRCRVHLSFSRQSQASGRAHFRLNSSMQCSLFIRTLFIRTSSPLERTQARHYARSLSLSYLFTRTTSLLTILSDGIKERLHGRILFQVTWRYQGRPLGPSPKHFISYKNNLAVLRIKQASLEDQGSYTAWSFESVRLFGNVSLTYCGTDWRRS